MVTENCLPSLIACQPKIIYNFFVVLAASTQPLAVSVVADNQFTSNQLQAIDYWHHQAHTIRFIYNSASAQIYFSGL